MAARGDRGRIAAPSYGNFDALLVGTEGGVLVDKTPGRMAAIWNGGSPRHLEKLRPLIGEIVQDFKQKL
jgi:hypothetical protein